MGHNLKSLDIDISSCSKAKNGINNDKIEKICKIFGILPNLKSF